MPSLVGPFPALPGIMSLVNNFKLQCTLDQLSGLTPTELSEVKAAVDRQVACHFACHLAALGANGDLTPEEWARIDSNELVGCCRMVRERTGLGLRDSKAYMDRARAKGRSDAPTDFSNGGRWEGEGTK